MFKYIFIFFYEENYLLYDIRKSGSTKTAEMSTSINDDCEDE